MSRAASLRPTAARGFAGITKSRGKLGLGRNKTEFGGGAAVRLPYVSCMAGRPKAGVELTLN